MTNRLGFFTSLALLGIGAAYAVVTGIGVALAGDAPIADPVLAVMEALTLLSAPLIVAILAVIHQRSPPERQSLSLSAFGFGLIMAALTSAVHFVGLSAGRQPGPWMLAWPSTAYAVELLAWDVFLGLALLFAAAALGAAPHERPARWALIASGSLSLLGTAGPLTGDMSLQRIGIVGYGLVLPVGWALLAKMFRGPAPL